MTTTTELIILPRTYAAIDAEFSGKSNAGLRADLKAAALYGSVSGKRQSVALTASGIASLNAVQAVLIAEFAEHDWDKVNIGPSGPEYDAPVVAYLDQPIAR